MARAEYEEDRLTTDEDLREDGAEVVLLRKVGGSVDPATGAHNPGVDVEVPTHALLKAYKAHEIDGDSILRTDTKCMLSAQAVALAGIVPQVGDMLRVEGLGKTFRVMDSQPLAPGGIAVLYWLQLRTG